MLRLQRSEEVWLVVITAVYQVGGDEKRWFATTTPPEYVGRPSNIHQKGKEENIIRTRHETYAFEEKYNSV